MLCAIPIEIASRELDGVIYLALHLAKRGLPTLFGERMVTQYVKHNNQPVLYFDIEQYAPINRHVLDCGGAVFNLNAEGFAFLCEPEFISIFEHIKDDVSTICVFGQRQYDIIRDNSSSGMEDLLEVTGHHAFDLVSERFIPFFRNESISERHGEDFILINANNGIFNHAMGFDYYLKMIQGMDEWQIYNDEGYLDFLRKQFDYQKDIAEAKVALAIHLSQAFPERHIILRPHPTESNAYYSDQLKAYSNVFVDNREQVREWIASAGAVVHHDCTTALEAMLMGKPVIQFRPVYDEDLVDPLLAGIGIEARNSAEVEQLVREGGMPEDIKQAQLERLKPTLANIEFSAAEKISSMAVDVSKRIPETWIPESPSLWGSIKVWRKHLSKVLRSKQPGRNGRKVSYALSKFPRLPVEEVQRRIDRLRAIETTLPEVELTDLTLNTFLMQPK